MRAVMDAGLKTVSAEPITRPLRVEISYFYLEGGKIDLDNIAKPICDALKNLVYRDDSQIWQLYLKKLALDGNFTLRETPEPLALALQKGEDFIYVAVLDLEDF
jgi:hypothetical protein